VLGYAECIGIAPEVFALGEDNICVIVDPEAVDDESSWTPPARAR
jgi:hypothetical protein